MIHGAWKFDNRTVVPESFQARTKDLRTRERLRMKPKACVFLFDGLADWEPALALCEIRKSGKYEVVTAGPSRSTVVTMGGMKVAPDITIDEIEPGETAIFILPGGDRWEDGPNQKVDEVLQRLH